MDEHYMSNKNTLFNLADGIARLTLANPLKRNVLSRDTLLEMRDALQTVEQGRAHLLIIDAQGPVFSSGGDLSDPLTQAGELGTMLKDCYHPVLRALVGVSCPVVCVVDGMVVGGACGLVLACDMVIATKDARFAFPFANIGLIPDCGLSWLLPQVVGPIRARSILLFGETIEADDAYRLGIATHRVETDRLAESMEALLADFRGLDRDAQVAAKRSLAAAREGTLAQTLSDEVTAQNRAGASARFREILGQGGKPLPQSQDRW